MRTKVGLRAVLLVPVIALVAVMTVFKVLPASAATVVMLQSYATGECLADLGGADRGIGVKACITLGDFRTRWYKSGYGDGTYRLQNMVTGRCVDESVDKGLRMNPTCNPPGSGAKYQAWKYSGMGLTDAFRLQVQSTMTCLSDTIGDIHRPTLAVCVSASDARATHQIWIEYSGL
jgi:hypothetical protein